MKQKKNSSDWYIATTHWLTAGFAVPFLIALIIGAPLTLAFADNPKLLMPILMLLSLVSIWLGVIYSSKYVNKTYIIKDANKVVTQSTIILVLIGGGFRLWKLLQTGILTYESIAFVGVVLIFYFASKKYIKNS